MGLGASQSAQLSGRSAMSYVGSAQGFVDTCLHEKKKAKAVKIGGGSRSIRPAGHVARPTCHHLASYHLGQVSGAPILSVVARCCLAGRVVRL
jgi:hypothetical protein